MAWIPPSVGVCFPPCRLWDKDQGANSLFGGWSQDAWCLSRGERQRKGKSIRDTYINKVLLWAPGRQSLWDLPQSCAVVGEKLQIRCDLQITSWPWLVESLLGVNSLAPWWTSGVGHSSCLGSTSVQEMLKAIGISEPPARTPGAGQNQWCWSQLKPAPESSLSTFQEFLPAGRETQPFLNITIYKLFHTVHCMKDKGNKY